MFRTQASTKVVRQALARTHVQARFNATQATRALSNPTLNNIEKRWESMPLQEQAELWMALRDRMKGSWKDLTLQEQKAAYWVAFGPHGPRALDPPGEGKKLLFHTVLVLGATLGIFGAIRFFGGKGPETMSKEWQEESNEYLKQQRAEPLTGYSSEGYNGPGMVQSPPKGA
ncbi:probable cytochrome-c oxidase chain V precursor [Cephalotrichum gorgonifer]|uniref:Cytochrome c oxidase polypeptide V n=1 Tax=Cephalotrichum gorgonifer TaxID=2041049 RepID=A0AAE8N4X2_9PEZI|nr:probable cytochrome-c oxidase chain V precursor [Cephalotrichum gorgonifer]